MGANDAAEMLEVAKAEVARLEQELEKLKAVAILMDKVERGQPSDIDGQIYTIPWAQDIVAAVSRIEPGAALREVRATALTDAVTEFEFNVGVTEFDEQTSTDGRHWTAIADAWELQGPFMEWLRNRATAIREGRA